MSTTSIKQLFQVLEKAKSLQDKHLALENIAEYYYRHMECDNAVKYYRKALNVALQLGDAPKQGTAYRMIAQIKSELGVEVDLCLEYFKKYLEIARSQKSSLTSLIEQQRALTSIGRTYFMIGQTGVQGSKKCVGYYENAKTYTAESLLVAHKIVPDKETINKRDIVEMKKDIVEMKVRSLLNLGVIYEAQDEVEKGLEKIRVAVDLSRKENLIGDLQLCLSTLGGLLSKKGDFEEAFECFREAFSAAQKLTGLERAKAITDVYTAESEAFCLKRDLSSAKSILIKSYSRVKNCKQLKEGVAQQLCVVEAMCRAESRLRETNLSYEEQYVLHEKLGDGYTLVKCYLNALIHYKKMLEAVKAGDLGLSKLRASLISLAATSKDLKNFKGAIRYFEEEMQYGTTKEAVSTLLAIAECQDYDGASDFEETYKKAVEMAYKLGDTKLQITALKELAAVQKESGDCTAAEETERKAKQLEATVELDEDESPSDADSVPRIGEDVDLDEILEVESNEDDEDEENFAQPSRRNPPRQKTDINRWKNEKGETKLHRAVIENRVTAVKSLIGQGADVNAMDYAGWTPLHEACNNGHLEVIEILLSHGAEINHKGGDLAQGLTPLHDAASAGNFDVVNKLLDHGASVKDRTAKGHNALHSLMKYHERRERDGDPFTAEDQMEYNHLVDRLRIALINEGIIPNETVSSEEEGEVCPAKVPKKVKVSRPPVGNLRNTIDHDNYLRKKRTMRSLSPDSISSESPPLSPADDQSDEGREGILAYQNAMKELKNQPKAKISKKQAKKDVEPLLNPDEVVDDWLEDDMRARPAKKRRTVDKSFENSRYNPLSVRKSRTSTGSVNRSSLGSNESGGSRRSRGSLGSGGVKSPEVQNVFSDYDMDVSEDTPSRPEENNCRSTLGRRQSSLLDLGITTERSPTPIQFPSVSPPPRPISYPQRVRINVSIEDCKLAVPVSSQENTIGWLAAEASNRFHSIKGCRPRLSLKTTDGALLCNDDRISLVLGGGDADVVAIVESWNVNPIAERYKDACNHFLIDTDENLIFTLETAEATHKLEVANKMWPFTLLRPVFRALSLQHDLVRINFANNKMKDDGLKDLCENVSRLAALRELNISGNSITSLGLEHLANDISSKGILKHLRELNLSHNLLGDFSVKYLANLTGSLPELISLHLADCGFTHKLWDGHDHYLTLNALKVLDLSANQLGAKGLAGFLGFSDYSEGRSLRAECLEVLHLVGMGGSHLCKELKNFFEKGESIALRELQLSYIKMNDKDLSPLLNVLDRAKFLHTIRLPSARHITGEIAYQIFKRTHPIHCLEIIGPEDMWKSVRESELHDAISAAAIRMESLTLKYPPPVVEDVWKDVWRHSGVIKRGARGLLVLENH